MSWNQFCLDKSFHNFICTCGYDGLTCFEKKKKLVATIRALVGLFSLLPNACNVHIFNPGLDQQGGISTQSQATNQAYYVHMVRPLDKALILSV